MKRELTITIDGAVGAGKSLTADILREVLTAAGAEVIVKDGGRSACPARELPHPVKITINVEQK